MALQAGLYKLRARRRSNLVRSAYRGLRGTPTADVYTTMDDFVDHEIPRRIYPEVLARIESHLAQGARVVIITTGMEPLVERCLRHFPPGIEVIGCLLQERAGRLTGRVDGPLFGVDKANILKAYCKSLGLDPGDCWAYSDHWSDKEMLQAVGHPVTVNPRGRLRSLALKEGWEILEPRPRD
jgi:phosphoserine phosphatase